MILFFFYKISVLALALKISLCVIEISVSTNMHKHTVNLVGLRKSKMFRNNFRFCLCKCLQLTLGHQKSRTVNPVLKYFLPIALKNFKGYFLCGVLNLIVTAAAPFIEILTLPVIIDELLGKRRLEILIMCIAIIVVGDIIVYILSSVLSLTMEKYNERMQIFFTEEMSCRVMEMNFQHTESKKALDQIEKARAEMSFYSGGVHGICTQLFTIISNIITPAGVITLIAVHAPILFILVLVILAVNTLVRAKINKIEFRVYNKQSKIDRIFSYLGRELTDFTYGKDIRLYGASDMMLEKWNKFSDETVSNRKSQAGETISYDMITVVTGIVRDIGSYLYLGILAITSKITIGVFSQMLSESSVFDSPLNNVMQVVQEIGKRCNYAYEYIKFMDYPAAIQKGNKRIENKPHTVEFRNVSFTYPNTDVKVLNNVSPALNSGEHLAVV